VGAKGLTINRVAEPPEMMADGSFSDFYRSVIGGGSGDAVEQTFEQIYKTNGIVFACIAARMMPFSEVRFQYQRMVRGRPGEMWGDASLSLLENPWTNGSTGELLARMEQDASLSGNFFAVKVKDDEGRWWIRRLRPDWVRVLTGIPGVPNTENDLRARVLGYYYEPQDGHTPMTFMTPDIVVHYSPIPDPESSWRGMSWLKPVLPETRADAAATRHKERYFTNGAALSTVIRYDKGLAPESFKKYVELFEEAHRGPANAYKTLHIGGGADVSVVGSALSRDFREIQGAGETRIAAASGVGAIIARFSEGLQGSSLNAGNYGAAKRQFGDMTLRPLWRTAATALAKFADAPADSRLWYDPRDVEFLKDDRKDAAEILSLTAQTMNALITAGYEPESVRIAVETGDLSRLVHSGLYSVQLQASGAGAPAAS